MAGFRMTPKRFARLSDKTPSDTLIKHQEFLSEYPFTNDILSSSLKPNEKLKAIKSALLDFDLRSQMNATEQYFANLKSSHKKTITARYSVRIVNQDNETLQTTKTIIDDNGVEHTESVPMKYPAKDYSSAERLADQRIYSRSDAFAAIVSDTTENPIETLIERRDAMRRILAKPKAPVFKAHRQTAGSFWVPQPKASKSKTSWFAVG
jgi:hypothetical protein